MQCGWELDKLSVKQYGLMKDGSRTRILKVIRHMDRDHWQCQWSLSIRSLISTYVTWQCLCTKCRLLNEPLDFIRVDWNTITSCWHNTFPWIPAKSLLSLSAQYPPLLLPSAPSLPYHHFSTFCSLRPYLCQITLSICNHHPDTGFTPHFPLLSPSLPPLSLPLSLPLPPSLSLSLSLYAGTLDSRQLHHNFLIHLHNAITLSFGLSAA